jgi:phosphate transport system protein
MTETGTGHIVKRFDQELAGFRGLVLEMGELALEQVRQSVDALCNEDITLARQIVKRESLVDNFDLQADEAATRLLAMRQPMAGDLRMILALSKTVTDLERIGDEAEKIAKAAIRHLEHDVGRLQPALLRDARTMCDLATRLLERALDALAEKNWQEAVAVVQGDKDLDAEMQAALRRLSTYILEDSRNVGQVIDAALIVKALERVGDHAKNIAESVVYQIKGKDVRYMKVDHLSDGFLDD